jgi:hypothetical protein
MLPTKMSKYCKDFECWQHHGGLMPYARHYPVQHLAIGMRTGKTTVLYFQMTQHGRLLYVR